MAGSQIPNAQHSAQTPIQPVSSGLNHPGNEPETIGAIEVHDVRFPTSQELDGSDAMNPDPDYSLAYVILRTTRGHEGHGFTFTIGRGTEIVTTAIHAMTPALLGAQVSDILENLGGLARRLTGDSQLRWLGPEKGVIQLATAALLNAVWDLAAKRAGKPLWKFLSDMSAEEIVDLVDWRYLSDALTPGEALTLLRKQESLKPDREAQLLQHGYPAYTTTPGWLGYDDDKLARLCRHALRQGFTSVKLKVGADLDDDIRRVALARRVLGPGIKLMIDANQRWDVGSATRWLQHLQEYDLHWVEEPTSPDDILAHLAIAQAIHPTRIATGEHAANRIIFKQLMALNAIGYCQIDACRVAGVNENVATLLLARRFGVPVCPHAGGVGLCELVQHLSMFDFIAVSGSMDGRMIEYVDHLHEHLVYPVCIDNGRYRAPTAPGYSSELHKSSREKYSYPANPAPLRPAASRPPGLRLPWS